MCEIGRVDPAVAAPGATDINDYLLDDGAVQDALGLADLGDVVALAAQIIR